MKRPKQKHRGKNSALKVKAKPKEAGKKNVFDVLFVYGVFFRDVFFDVLPYIGIINNFVMSDSVRYKILDNWFPVIHSLHIW